jgi:hypothetical protein
MKIRRIQLPLLIAALLVVGAVAPMKAVLPARILVVGGGGGGGALGGGGGGGGVLYNAAYPIVNASYVVTLGAGGLGAGANATVGTAGQDSVFDALRAYGGGGGAGNASAASSGGSGGGGSNSAAKGLGVSGQGNDGGTSAGVGPSGGGGAAAVGTSNIASNEVAGVAGGAGAANSISGSSVTYAGGGGSGGASQVGASFGGGVGGAGGGGAGGGSIIGTPAAASGAANTGGGGGGGGYNGQGPGGEYSHAGGNGGSGIVIIRYASTSMTATGGTITTVGSDTVHTFTSSGTFTIMNDGAVPTIGDPTSSQPPLSSTSPSTSIAKYNAAGSLVPSAISEVYGNIGIGTSTPASMLHVAGDLTISKGDTTYLTTETNTFPMFMFKSAPYGNPGANPRFGRVGLYGDTAFLSDNVGFDVTKGWAADATTAARSMVLLQQGNVIFQSQVAGGPDGAMVGRMVILPNGDVKMAFNGGSVGIGTNEPTAKLHVAGNVVVDGNIAAKYQDIAEWVPATTAEPAGTVLVARRGVLNLVERSMRSYDTSVVGVVSPQPGIVLGEPASDRVLVAHSGRVRVKADASYGPIEAGDLLVTSPIPGFAMRSEPLAVGGGAFHRPGTLLGKALEPLASGQGEILVLLTLQ